MNSDKLYSSKLIDLAKSGGWNAKLGEPYLKGALSRLPRGIDKNC
tara:strand:- start:134 stop:268 length:135 start_codon:yes stop_codon:yes gene_type:complete